MISDSYLEDDRQLNVAMAIENGEKNAKTEK
jgi:hypothetical protein